MHHANGVVWEAVSPRVRRARVKNAAASLLAIDRALDACGLDAKDVDYVNAHATSTPAGDMAELRVLQEKFGKNPG